MALSCRDPAARNRTVPRCHLRGWWPASVGDARNAGAPAISARPVRRGARVLFFALVFVLFARFLGSPLMSALSPAELALAELLVESLNLDGVTPAEIDPEAPLFGAGLGLDSIDALELSLAISKRYGFQLRSDNEDNRRIFGSLRALSAHVEQHKTA
jgi:acyl carrier protein